MSLALRFVNYQNTFFIELSEGTTNSLKYSIYLNHLLFTMDHYYKKISNHNFSVINQNTQPYPSTQSESHILFVYVSPKQTFFAQLGYQFAHEYCHLIINKSTAQKFGFFQESLCELASIFFMHAQGILWQQSPVFENMPDYGNDLIEYANEIPRYEQIIPFNLHFLADNKSSITQELYSDSTNRSLNVHIAESIRPIFEKFPCIWQEVSSLPSDDTESNLKDYLISWKNAATNKDGFDELISLF